MGPVSGRVFWPIQRNDARYEDSLGEIGDEKNRGRYTSTRVVPHRYFGSRFVDFESGLFPSLQASLRLCVPDLDDTIMIDNQPRRVYERVFDLDNNPFWDWGRVGD